MRTLFGTILAEVVACAAIVAGCERYGSDNSIWLGTLLGTGPNGKGDNC